MSLRAQLLDRWRKDDILRHGAILFVAAQAGSVCNLIFQVLIMRTLPAAEYAVFAAMYSVYLIAVTPLEAFRTAVAHDVAERAARGTAWWPAVRRWGWILAGVGLAVFAAGWCATGAVLSFFALHHPAPFHILTLMLAVAMLYPVGVGGLQGVQAFGRLAVAGQAFGVARLAFAAVLLALSWRTAGAMLWAQAAGVLAMVAVPFAALARLNSPPAVAGEAVPSAGGPGYAAHAVVGLGAYAVLMNADMALAKHLFDTETTATFSRAATIGRALVFLPMPIAMALFPKIVGAAAREAQARHALMRALAYTLLIVGGMAAALTLAAPWIWRLFTGAPLAPADRLLVAALTWAFVPLAPVFTLLNFALARRRFRAGYGAAAAAVAYVVLVMNWGGRSPLVIPAALAACSLVLLGGLAWAHARSAPRTLPA